jgi:hypothetical protein
MAATKVLHGLSPVLDIIEKEILRKRRKVGKVRFRLAILVHAHPTADAMRVDQVNNHGERPGIVTSIEIGKTLLQGEDIGIGIHVEPAGRILVRHFFLFLFIADKPGKCPCIVLLAEMAGFVTPIR